ncbi:MAG: galactokinase family protein [Blastocatellia bacterium]
MTKSSLEIYGDDEALQKHMLNRLSAQCELFERYYGSGAASALSAPARINILGEHVDYVSYLPTSSLPFASREQGMVMIYRANQTSRVRGASTLNQFTAAEFDLTAVAPVRATDNVRADWQAYLFNKTADAPHWINYVKAAVYFARFKHGAGLAQGFDFLIDSEIPAGGGSSSSSALTVLAGAAARAVNNIYCDARELAFDSASAEWYVGTRGGAMDHLTICLAKRHNAVHIDYAEGRIALVEVPDGEFRWLTFFSHAADKGREAMLEYNERAAVARVIIPALIYNLQPALYERWQAVLLNLRPEDILSFDELQPVINELPEFVRLCEFEQQAPEAYRECARAFPALALERYKHSLKVRDRALHHLSESRRVAAAVEIFRDKREKQPESQMSQLGDLLNRSHESLRDSYDLCTPDVNELSRIIQLSPGVYGARLMGAGFGGNVLALAKRESVFPLIDRIQAEFYRPRGRDPIAEGAILVSTMGDGLSSLDSDFFKPKIIDQP